MNATNSIIGVAAEFEKFREVRRNHYGAYFDLERRGMHSEELDTLTDLLDMVWYGVLGQSHDDLDGIKPLSA